MNKKKKSKIIKVEECIDAFVGLGTVLCLIGAVCVITRHILLGGHL